MSRSVSFRTSSKMTSIAHNNRTEEDEKKLKDIDKHIRWEDVDKNVMLESKDIREVYHEQFHADVIKYNIRQKRKDRKIDQEYGGYYKKLRDEQGKGNAEVQREFIVQFGTKDDEWFNLDTSNEMFTEYLEEFKERNPDMVVYNAVIHNDERTPHMHFNVVPVGRGYKRGVASKPSFTKALESSGVDFDEFQERERDSLARIMKEHTNEDRKLVGTHDYIPPAQYREMMGEAEKELEESRQKIDEAEQKLKESEQKLKESERKLKEANQVNEKAAESFKSSNERVGQLNNEVAKINNHYAKINDLNKKNADRSSKLDDREQRLEMREGNLEKGEEALRMAENDFKERESKLIDAEEKQKELEERENKLEEDTEALEGSKKAFETFKGKEVEKLNETVKNVQKEHSAMFKLREQVSSMTIDKLEELREKLKKPVDIEKPELYDDDLADLNDDEQMKL